MDDEQGIDVNAQLNISLGNLGKAIDRNTMFNRLATKAQYPVNYNPSATVIIPSGGFAVVKIGGPDLGHFWQVRRIAVGGLSPTTVAAGRADIFVSAGDLRAFTTFGQFSITDWRD